jgi:peptide-methionine (S)-S-oxide reductase
VDAENRGKVRTVTTRRWVVLVAFLGLLGVGLMVFAGVDPAMPPAGRSAGSAAVPAPDVDEPAPASVASGTAVLAGGCFWGVQGVFQHVKGVTAAESGYAGGDRATATYGAVSSGSTGHAESVRITYDPAKVTYGRLLQIYFSVVTDPTQLDRQGPDVGSQYRSAIFAQNADQQRIAAAYIAQLSQANVFPAPIMTRVEPNTGFFPAEAYHQNYLDSHPTSAYIVMNDKPKVDDLARLFPQRYRDQPVLVSVA